MLPVSDASMQTPSRGQACANRLHAHIACPTRMLEAVGSTLDSALSSRGQQLNPNP